MRSIKKIAKQFLDNNIGEADLRYECIPNNVECISFDIFDTLIVRDVSKPEGVFKLLEKENGIKEFTRIRKEAEGKAKALNAGHEVDLNAIYSCIQEIDVNNVLQFCEKEIEKEIAICQPNHSIIDFFNACVRNHRVVLTSDMYLTSKQLERILNKCGIVGYEKIYVSSELDCKKADGTLYDFIIKDLGIKKQNIVHIGNDYKADYVMAKGKGLNAMKLKMNYNHMLIKKSRFKELSKEEQLSFDCLRVFINNHTKTEKETEDYFYKYGYENLGILLWGFCNWIHDSFITDGIRHALFLARDGYIIKKAYDEMGLSKSVSSGYLEMSRRSVRVPAIFSQDINYEEMLSNLSILDITTIEQVFDGWGLDYVCYKDVIKKFNINLDEIFIKSQLQNDLRLRDLYNFLKNEILKNAREEKELLYSYVKKFDLQNKTAIIDIGYNGTIQKELICMLNSKGIPNDIKGYYMMLSRNARKHAVSCDFKAKGFIFDHFNYQDDPYEVLPFTGMFETLFLEQDGSVKRYRKVNDDVVAERFDFEYEEFVSNGINEVEKIRILQKGAIEFVKEFHSSPLSKELRITPKVAFCLMNNTLCRPNQDMIKHFGKFCFFDMGNLSFLAYPKKTILQYIVCPKCLIQEYYDSRWRIGFLKAVFRINIPVIELLKMRKRIIKTILHRINKK